jgi:putative transport protein
MKYLEHLLPSAQGGPAGLAILSLAVALGLAIGAIQFRGIKLGISGVLFSSLLFGQIGLTVDPNILAFLRDFSLILFAYAIGLQVGPGFSDSLKAEGLRLNCLAILVLVLGAALTIAVVKAAGISKANSTGLYSGAFTTTPGLAAGQEVLRHSTTLSVSDAVKAAGLAYAVTYPIGMIGPVWAVAFMRRWFKVNMPEERRAHAAAVEARRPATTNLDIEITQAAATECPIKHLCATRGLNVIFSRLLRDGKVSVPTGDTRLEIGDVIRAVGAPPVLEEVKTILGKPSTIDLASVSGDISRMELLVTQPQMLRRTLRELDLINRFGVTLPRILRFGVDLIPNGDLALRFGDVVSAVGPAEGLKAVEKELGNSPDAMNRPQLVPIFLGIVLGVIVGSIPIPVPGVAGGIKLGLAAGPMVVAIALSSFGNIGSVVWYMPGAANQLFRDFGLALFLACVGLQQGDQYIQKLLSGDGLKLVALGIAVTALPILAVGFLARKWFKMNFLTLSGWAAGAMTSSPALLYAGEITGSDAPALAYAAVAPLGMIVPILCCQALAAL